MNNGQPGFEQPSFEQPNNQTVNSTQPSFEQPSQTINPPSENLKPIFKDENRQADGYIPPIVDEDETTVGGWIGWMLLCSILPIIGQIIMLCCAKNKTIKNYAKANLILVAIAFVLVIFLVAIVGVSISELL